MIGRQHFSEVRHKLRVQLIQQCVRGWLARRQYRCMVRGVTLLQAEVRRRIARQHWKELKVPTQHCIIDCFCTEPLKPLVLHMPL